MSHRVRLKLLSDLREGENDIEVADSVGKVAPHLHQQDAPGVEEVEGVGRSEWDLAVTLRRRDPAYRWCLRCGRNKHNTNIPPLTKSTEHRRKHNGAYLVVTAE
eukprot:gene13989-biopygen1013